MKKLMISVLICTILSGCSGDGPSEDVAPTPVSNNAPSIPSLVSPSNNLLCIANTLEFKWNASTDPDGDAIQYIIELSRVSQFSSIDKSATVSNTNYTFTLERGVTYYWRIKAVDSKNNSSGYSSVYNLYTEGEGTVNHLPLVPQLIMPVSSPPIESGLTTLEWSGSDPDGDVLTYDIYLSEIYPPTALISQNQSETILKVNTLPGSKYFWKVVAKDENGAQTIGQIWDFSTD